MLLLTLTLVGSPSFAQDSSSWVGGQSFPSSSSSSGYDLSSLLGGSSS